MPRLRVETLRRPLRWLAAAALVALVPKCLVCLAAYAGLGAALGFRFAVPELCGASAGNAPHTETWLTATGVVVAVATLWLATHAHNRKPAHHHCG